MTNHRFPHLLCTAAAAFVLLLVAACSAQKNTRASRFWQAMNAKYNTYYNGTLAYIDGSLEKEQGNQDNFTEMLPFYTVGNKASRELGKSNFDIAIQKSEKAIHQHSIKRRPEWKSNRRKTARDVEWLSRKEYNPFLWKAWMLMGRSQFYEGNFDDAASTFAYMARLYATQPAINNKARAWLAKCYVEQGWLYDAEQVIRDQLRDSINWHAQKEWDFTLADYYLHAGDYQKAIPYMRKSIKHEMRKLQKARLWYLLGQVYEQTNQKALAYKAYHHVVRLNPPYLTAFNARIAMTEVLAGKQSRQMISRLKRMAASDNNKDYLDQVYYAIGNIYLAAKDTAQAISNYEKGRQKATRSGIEKGVLLLKLGDIYWQKEKYKDAQGCYGEAIGLLDKERPDYEQLSQRSKVLDELVPYTDAIQLQDSLQALAKMSEADRNAAIDRTIAALKKKEKEERRKQQEANAANTLQQNSGNNVLSRTTNNRATNTRQSGKTAIWYFYNPAAVSQGKANFQRQWGQRKNVDNWQRINQTVVAGMGGTENADSALAGGATAATDSLQQQEGGQPNDSAANDPHKREYYLAQIPFTPEQLEASNQALADGLYNAGVIFKDKLDNLPLSEKELIRLVTQFPDYAHNDEAFYHLYLLYMRLGRQNVATEYLDKLKQQYPKSDYTAILTNPYFQENATRGTQLEDSLYTATYEAFKAARYQEVLSNDELSEKRFPDGDNRDKFVFVAALAKLDMGKPQQCVQGMEKLVRTWPQSSLAEMAGMIVNGVKAGRRLQGGSFALGNVWQRRTEVMADSDSIKARRFTFDPQADYVFMMVYPTDSVNENQLLFNLARYNFTSYLVRNFDINVEDTQDGLHRMSVAGFRNFAEALQYARQLYAQHNFRRFTARVRPFIVSTANLPLIGQQYSYNDYQKFYNAHFGAIKLPKADLLSEPDSIITEPAEPDTLQQPGTTDEGTQPDAGGTYIMPEGTTGGATDQQGTQVYPVDAGQQGASQQQGTTDQQGTQDYPVEAQPQGTARPQGTTKTAAPAKQSTEPAKSAKPVDKDTIYFDDAPAAPAGNNNNNSKKKLPEDNSDLEDEYYDLDGF